MTVLAQILLATIVVSATSLVGLFTIALDEIKLRRLLFLGISLAAGALMASAFLHLLPEALQLQSGYQAMAITLVAFILFLTIERLLTWQHYQRGQHDHHTLGAINLLGDGIHNFLDGLIIAASFLTNPALGISTTIAVAMHEIPHEIGDFSVLLYSGYSRQKALLLNLVIAGVAILGGLVGYYLHGNGVNLEPLLLPLAAGGFIYIASADLLPEIRKETSRKKSLAAFSLFLIGVVVMIFVG